MPQGFIGVLCVVRVNCYPVMDSNNTIIFSESSPEQMPPLEQLPTKQPRTTRSSQGQKRSIIIDKKSADGVWALLEMAKGRPKSSK